MLITKRKIKNFIKNIDPRVFGVNIVKDLQIRPMPKGGYNFNYLITINEKVHTVFRMNLEKDIEVSDQIVYEYGILKYLEYKFIGPRVYYLGQNEANFENKSILLEQYVEGVSPLSLSEFDLKQIVRKLHELHLVPKPERKILLAYENPLRDHYDFIYKKIDEVEKKDPQDKSIVTIKKFNKHIQSYVQKYANLFTKNDTVICHKDLIVDNILKTPYGIRFVDWQVAMIDDPSYDLAFFINDHVCNWSMQNTLLKKQKQMFLNTYKNISNDKHILEKTYIRSAFIYLEFMVWSVYRVQEIKAKLNQRQLYFQEKYFLLEKMKKYKSVLKEELINKYLKKFSTRELSL